MVGVLMNKPEVSFPSISLKFAALPPSRVTVTQLLVSHCPSPSTSCSTLFLFWKERKAGVGRSVLGPDWKKYLRGTFSCSLHLLRSEWNGSPTCWCQGKKPGEDERAEPGRRHGPSKDTEAGRRPASSLGCRTFSLKSCIYVIVTVSY